jgi:hypothetical protein
MIEMNIQIPPETLERFRKTAERIERAFCDLAKATVKVVDAYEKLNVEIEPLKKDLSDED